MIKIISYITVACVGMVLGVLLGLFSAQMVIKPVIASHEKIITVAVEKSTTTVNQNVGKVKGQSDIGMDNLITPLTDSIPKKNFWRWIKGK